MKKQKKPLKFKPEKSKPATKKPPAFQPKPAARAATATPRPEPKTFDSIRLSSLEYRVVLIEDQVKEIFYGLGQIEACLGQRLRHFALDTASEKSETQ
jgi:hypothetical protein